MKKITLVLVILLITSCTKNSDSNLQNENSFNFNNVNSSKKKFETIKNSESKNLLQTCAELSELSENNLSGGNCLLAISDPFIDESVTFSFECSSYPLVDCFNTNLEASLISVIQMQFFPPDSNASLAFSGVIYLELDQVIDTTDIYPFMSVSDANTIWWEIACQIKNEITNAYPGRGEAIGSYIEITYLSTDFGLCGGSPEDSVITVDYQVWKN